MGNYLFLVYFVTPLQFTTVIIKTFLDCFGANKDPSLIYNIIKPNLFTKMLLNRIILTQKNPEKLQSVNFNM